MLLFSYLSGADMMSDAATVGWEGRVLLGVGTTVVG